MKKIDTLINTACHEYLIEPSERNARFFAILVRLKQYKKLPFEWREAVAEEIRNVAK